MSREFSSYISAKRYEKDLKLKDVASKTGMSVSYISDIFKGRRLPPAPERLDLFAKSMCLDKNEREEMFDLAAKERGVVSCDLAGYIMDESLPTLRKVLRRAKKQNFKDTFWKEVGALISSR